MLATGALASGKRERICAKPQVRYDYKFCNSFRDTAASICRNISEGFTRFTSPYIVQYFGYALSSIAELKDHFAECLVRKAIDQAEYARLVDQVEHVKATALNFMRPHIKRVKDGEQERGRRKRHRST
jgi:four helix bundle protein